MSDVDDVLRGARPGKDVQGLHALAGIRARLFGRHSGPVRIGRYELRERLGAGGLGVVHAAYDPKLDREVAIKLLRDAPGIDTVREQHRLLREGRAMAQLNHPNVVEVFDVGTYEGLEGLEDLDDDELPRHGVFIVMARLEGKTLEQWLRADWRPWQLVLERFVAAGRGLVAAHAAGLVHRDFKPANVFVQTDGRVRVLDFGLARGYGPSGSVTIDAASSDGAFDAQRSISVAGAILGTPAYMAPEQHDARAIDARSDQYSFCAALYRGLYGVLPFEGTGMGELLERKRAVELSPGSEVAIPRWLVTAIRRGLSPEPTDRWPSMAMLLRELDRRARRSRRRMVVVGSMIGVAGLGVLVSGAILPSPMRCDGGEGSVTWTEATATAVEQGLSAHEAGARALPQVLAGLEAYASSWHDEHRATCKATLVQLAEPQLDLRMRCLRRAEIHFDTVVEALTDADARVADRASTAVASLPGPEDCRDLDALRTEYGSEVEPADAEAAEALRGSLARLSARVIAGEIDQAGEEAQRCRAEAEALGHPPLLAEALWWQGHVRRIAGEYEAAMPGLEQAAHLAAAHGHDKIAALAAVEMTLSLDALARFPEALEWARHAEAAGLRFGEDRYPLARAHASRAGVLRKLGRKEEAYALYLDAVEVQTRVDATGHDLPTILNNVGTTALMLGRNDEAYEHYQRSYRRLKDLLGTEHPQTAAALMNLGIVSAELGRDDDALRYYGEARETFVRLFGVEDQRVAYCDTNLGNLLLDQGELEPARDRFASARDRFAELLGPGHPNTVTARASWGLTQLKLGENVLAREALERALTDMREAVGPEHPQVSVLMGQVGRAFLAEGKLEAARERMEAALSLCERTEAEPGRVYEIRFHLARLRWEEGDPAGAWADVQDVLAWAREHGAPAERAEIEDWLTEHPRPATPPGP